MKSIPLTKRAQAIAAASAARAPEELIPVLESLGLTKDVPWIAKLLFRFIPRKRYRINRKALPKIIEEINSEIAILNDSVQNNYRVPKSCISVFLNCYSVFPPQRASIIYLELGQVIVRLDVGKTELYLRRPTKALPPLYNQISESDVEKAHWFFCLPDDWSDRPRKVH